MRPLSSAMRSSFLALVLPAMALLTPACSQAPARSDAPDAVPVLAAAVVRKDVPIEIHEIGTVQAYATVSIRTQVGGVLQKAHFREGQDVRAGDLLFTLDARPYAAALEAAEAALARDSVQHETATHDVERYASLVQKEYVNQEEFDRIRTSAASLEAAVRGDRAAIENARVELEHCTIRSPIDGRTGQLMVNAGNVVKANSDDPLVVINQLEPIYAAFSLPEQSLPGIKEHQSAEALQVRATIMDAGAPPLVGALSFIDNAVDRSTGTVRLKATFPNHDRALWPGQFVNVSLKLAVRSGVLVVPTQAIQTGQQGAFVFVVKSDSTVELRPVVSAAAIGAESIIEKGLEEGETVVTDGQLRLLSGVKVEVKSGLTESRP